MPSYVSYLHYFDRHDTFINSFWTCIGKNSAEAYANSSQPTGFLSQVIGKFTWSELGENTSGCDLDTAMIL